MRDLDPPRRPEAHHRRVRPADCLPRRGRRRRILLARERQVEQRAQQVGVGRDHGGSGEYRLVVGQRLQEPRPVDDHRAVGGCAGEGAHPLGHLDVVRIDGAAPARRDDGGMHGHRCARTDHTFPIAEPGQQQRRVVGGVGFQPGEGAGELVGIRVVEGIDDVLENLIRRRPVLPQQQTVDLRMAS